MDLLMERLQSLEKEGYRFAMWVEAPQFTARYICSQDIVDTELPSSQAKKAILQHPPLGKIKDKPLVKKTYDLDLTNPYAVSAYFKNVFSALKQMHCKAITKAWIKVAEPKKKSKFPYIKGDLYKPPWWPADVEHREPDHLRKTDRIGLMVSILTQMVPHSGDPNLLKRLENSTLSINLGQSSLGGHALDDAYQVCKALCMGHSTTRALDFRLSDGYDPPVRDYRGPTPKTGNFSVSDSLTPVSSIGMGSDPESLSYPGLSCEKVQVKPANGSSGAEFISDTSPFQSLDHIDHPGDLIGEYMLNHEIVKVQPINVLSTQD
ncbi:LADA_0F02916g1_1 [Lachancea dasiensis]|uniref:LADA_0F02916g1_1 n=1 Tax=Lachancea dasiensis TaxID=1072105 RepID=A0A1G4JIY5_9SACH|nr:LADA_0F02916g1_1 [Lachancea dasiensis]